MAFATSEEVILENELELGCTFPLSFKNKMLKENGGEIEFEDEGWQIFPFYDKTDRKTRSRTCNSIIKETASASEWRGFPKEAIAIAGNGSGDFLVFLKKEKQISNEVYIWSHETTELTKVANNFSELTN